MMRLLILTVGTAMLIAPGASAQTGATGTSGTKPEAPAPAAPAMAGAVITDTGGRQIGEARFTQTPNGVLLRLELRNATPGVHALHIDEVGQENSNSDSDSDYRFGIPIRIRIPGIRILRNSRFGIGISRNSRMGILN